MWRARPRKSRPVCDVRVLGRAPLATGPPRAPYYALGQLPHSSMMMTQDEVTR